jgi:hypothetical protein
VDQGRFADQGYLDSFPGMSERTKIIENIGANLAPWNVGNYQIEFRDQTVTIDAVHPLIFFHFQGLKKDLWYFIFSSHRFYRAPFSVDVREHIYRPYIDELLAIEKTVSSVLQVSDTKPHRRSATINLRQFLVNRVRRFGVRLFQMLDLVTGRAFFVGRGISR